MTRDLKKLNEIHFVKLLSRELKSFHFNDHGKALQGHIKFRVPQNVVVKDL